MSALSNRLRKLETVTTKKQRAPRKACTMGDFYAAMTPERISALFDDELDTRTAVSRFFAG